MSKKRIAKPIIKPKRPYWFPRDKWELLRKEKKMMIFKLYDNGYRSYSSYLESDHWSEVKDRYRKSKLPKECLICGDKRYELHHRTYKRLGHEYLNDLIPLCRNHHSSLHRKLNKKSDKKMGLRGYSKIYVKMKKKDLNCPF